MTPQQPTPEPFDAPRRKGGGSKVLKWILIAFGIIVAGWALAAWIFVNSELGQRVMQGVEEARTLFEEGARGPGAEDLNALGCEPAMVTTFGRIMDVGRTIVPEMDPAQIPPETPFVFCQAPSDAPEFTCENVARVWGEATDAQEPFIVASSQGGEGCSGVFDREGNFLGDFAPDTPPSE